LKDYIESEELKERLLWLIRLRWIAGAFVLLSAYPLKRLGFLSFPLLPPFFISGIVFLYNLFFYVKIKKTKVSFSNTVLQLFCDQLSLGAGVYFSGGCDSPFIYFFIFHVVISSFIIPGIWPYIYATTGIILPGLVMFLKHIGVLPHFGILINEPVIFSDLKTMAVYGSAFLVTMYLTAYFANYLSIRVLKDRLVLRDLNLKLSSLLDCSRIAHSTLELEELLTRSLRIILNTTNLKAGLILLTEEMPASKCYDFFTCNAYNCPAYKAEINCWQLEGTMCHGDKGSCPFGLDAINCWKINSLHMHHQTIKTKGDKLHACSNCLYFLTSVLQPKLSSFKNGDILRERITLDGESIRKALEYGRVIVDYSRESLFELPVEPATILVIPLLFQKEIMGVFYLASDQELKYTPENIEFFQLLSDVLSSAIFNSKLYTSVENSFLSTILAIANALEAKDPYTRGHSERVARLCSEIAEVLGLSGQEKEHLRFAAILHDVGKIGVSRDLLTKHCALYECELEEIRNHPLHAVKILEPVSFLKPVLPAIKHHHENYDGSGYPDGLKGQAIPFKARILKVADAWDAMRSDRPYRKALPQEEAIDELLKGSGKEFDPFVVEAFLKVIEKGHN